MSGAEFSRQVKLDRVPTTPLRIEADPAERAALARRFDLPAIHALVAELRFTQTGDAVDARGQVTASYDQRCALSNEVFVAEMEEPVAVRFVPALTVHDEDEEVEFAPDEPDEIEYAGASFDAGEAVAQSFGLALDPYALGPNADVARREGGVMGEDAPQGPFAALAALKRD